MNLRLDAMRLFRRLGKAAPAPDFLRPTRGIHLLAWAGFAAALVALGLSAIDARLAWLERAQAREQLELAQLRLDRARTPPASNAARVPATPRLRDERQALLAYPWATVFQSVESASVAGVRWLALEHGHTGALRLEGQTADPAAALRVAEALQARPDWRDVGLSRIERADPASREQRFELKAQRHDGRSGGTP